MKQILLISLIFAVACTEQKSDLEKMRSDVMKIHDDSMEKIGEVRQAIFALEDVIDNNSDSLKIKELVLALENADEEMMLWMSEYKEPEVKLELKSFYEKEKEKIQIVADKIYKSLEDAQKYIDK